MPEARLNLAQATIALAVAPKSNAVIMAIDAAQADVRAGKIGSVPPHLRDGHYAGAAKLGHSAGAPKPYVYSHDEPFGIAEQQYAPDELRTRPTTAPPPSARRPRSRSAGSGSGASCAVAEPSTVRGCASVSTPRTSRSRPPSS